MMAADTIPRTLRYSDDRGETRRIAEADLLDMRLPLVVLGDPGSGKSTLLRALSDRSGFEFVTAKQLLRRGSAGTGDVLLVDALDEVATARETDAVQRVLQKLHALGGPPFVLSCRAAEWPGQAAVSEIRADYGREPVVVSLDPFGREDARTFLLAALADGAADGLLDHLDGRSLEGLYHNPLTLQLLADVANRHRTLPENRGELFATACDLLWSERAVAHEGSALGQMTRHEALLSAGAAAAAQLLTGAEAVTLRGAAFAEGDDLPVAAVETLPHGAAARAVIRSRLFAPVRGDQRFAPLHRVIAEYLGARWLAELVGDGVPLRRVLGMLVLNRTVPSSLRGLHAWLAFFSDVAAGSVLENDPYGVVRYGDVSMLPVGRLRTLLGALEGLARYDPYFRAEDWGRMSSRALARPELASDVERILTGSGNFHLRKLLIEAISGSSVAEALVGPLRAIVVDRGAVYAERYDAAEAIQPVIPVYEWAGLVQRLREDPRGDDGRLAVDMLGLGDPATASDQDIALTIAAFLGYTARPIEGLEEEREEERRPIGTMSGLARRIPDARLAGILDALCDRIQIPSEEDDWERRWELAYFAARGIRRALQHDPVAPALVWRWLQLLDDRHGRGRDDHKKLDAFMAQSGDLRRELQRHALFHDRGEKSVWMRSFRLGDKLDSLAVSEEDAVRLLADFGERPDATEEDQEDWQDLVSLARIKEGLSPEARAAARRFARGRPEALAFLRKASRPASNNWERRAERRRATVERNRERGWEKHRADFAEHRGELRAGELRWIVPPARAYLALFNDSDRDKRPVERLAEWLGPELAGDALAGFEAVLARGDLPTAEDVSASYADGRRWNMVYPMVAGVAERLRRDGSAGGVPRKVAQTVWLAAHHESYLSEHAAVDDLTGTLERTLGDRPVSLSDDYRLLLEPQFVAGSQHPSGLYRLMRETSLAAVATGLTIDWIARFASLPTIVELELVDHLLDAGQADVLGGLWQSRLAAAGSDLERRLLWLSTAFIADFERARPALEDESAAGGKLLFGIRNRLRRQDRSGRYNELGPDQLGWLVATFRERHGLVARPNRVTSGDGNPWDAADFLRQVITLLESDLSARAGEILIDLRDAAADDYTDLIRHAAAGQRRARDEAEYEPIAFDELLAVARNGPPRSIDDLQAVMVGALVQVQVELRASETNPLDAFYAAPGHPKGENYCRDRIVEWLRRALPTGVAMSTETRMPDDKRSDVSFTCGEALVPVEIKPQWNPRLWDAAIDQLDALYAREWRAKGRGIYLVLWFGATVDGTRALRPPPAGVAAPLTPGELAALLTERIPEARRGQLRVVVLDLER